MILLCFLRFIILVVCIAVVSWVVLPIDVIINYLKDKKSK